MNVLFYFPKGNIQKENRKEINFLIKIETEEKFIE